MKKYELSDKEKIDEAKKAKDLLKKDFEKGTKPEDPKDPKKVRMVLYPDEIIEKEEYEKAKAIWEMHLLKDLNQEGRPEPIMEAEKPVNPNDAPITIKLGDAKNFINIINVMLVNDVRKDGLIHHFTEMVKKDNPNVK